MSEENDLEEGNSPWEHVSQIKFANDEVTNINRDDIVVFVGPNNVGKSQALKDIMNISNKGSNVDDDTIIIKEIKIVKNKGDIKEYIKKISIKDEDFGENAYRGLDYLIYGHNYSFWDNEEILGEFTKVFMVYLDTLNRLNICNPAENIKRNQARTHPIHYAAYDSERRQWLTENYRTAFGEDLIPNTQYGSLIPLCIGKPVKLEGTYEDEQVRQEKYAEILEKYKQVQDQGDGIKSFTGILLYLMMDNYCTYLIDEPEAFLHPPQAKIMGSIIGKKLSTKKQAFIATHSEEIVKGLMESAPHRIKIIRIDRDENNNFISILNNNDFNKVWSDPLLRYSNIMSSLFHKTVVLCESDSDCRMYSIVDNYLKRQEGKYSETLFIHCGGKHRMAKIIIALKSLGVNIRVISDIDVLNDEGVIRGIAESVGLEWGETLKKYYNVLASNLHSSKENINRNEAKTTINRVLGQSDNQDLSNSEIKEIRNAIKLESKWKTIKDNGKIAIPSGEATDAFNKLSDALEDKDIFLVPVGELEGFVKDVGGHGPEWVNAVLERYPELDNPIFDTIKKFVITLNI